jgi:hypothetical protein
MSEVRVSVSIADFLLEVSGQNTTMSRKPTLEEITSLRIALSYISGVISGSHLNAVQR